MNNDHMCENMCVTYLPHIVPIEICSSLSLSHHSHVNALVSPPATVWSVENPKHEFTIEYPDFTNECDVLINIKRMNV